MVRDPYYKTPGTQTYNIHFKNGALESRVTERALFGLKAANIDWVWVVEQRRRATPDEIRKLCKGKS